MGYDFERGAGNIPSRQPANLVANTNEVIASTGTSTATITFESPVKIIWLGATINFKVAVGAPDSKPVVILKRNDIEIDRINYEVTFNYINSNLEDKLLYSSQGQKIDFVSSGDTYSLILETDGGSTGTIETFLNLNIIGEYQ